MSGAPEMGTGDQRQSQLRDAMNSCGVILHKWPFNSPELLNNYLSSVTYRVFFPFGPDSFVKTLGMSWKLIKDRIVFKVYISSKPSFTK
ncbi:uncharacterized protein TNCT_251231 [Trichonephila clavata]|uniref:Uncharacterized protein n=1 Tax=Trichonephila clavata TaxID=2740835 RepID=A0A8X6LDV3_TRICU|nr:uncharacterized protein TNCT_251231 [Trichonephila clavata]